jgi:hypothetical protein
VAQEIKTQVYKNGKMSLAMAINYAKRYPLVKLSSTYRVIAIEQVFAIRVPGFRIPISVKIDVVLWDTRNRVYWIMDHKTTDKDISAMAGVLPYSIQARLQKWVLQTWLNLEEGDTKHTVAGIIHNILKKPTIRQKQTETFEDYVTRVNEWWDEQDRKDPKNPSLYRSTIRHHGEYLDEELLVRLHQQHMYSSAALSLPRFFRNENLCFQPVPTGTRRLRDS